MIVIDTNVISEATKKSPQPDVMAWLAAHRYSDTFITTVTQAELLYGIARMPEGRRRAEVAQSVAGIVSEFSGHILSFSSESAPWYASIVARREALGRPIEPMDAMIAAIVRSHDATLATRDIADFADCGIRVVNPWEHTR